MREQGCGKTRYGVGGWPIQAVFWLEWGTFPAPRCTPLKQSLNGPPSRRRGWTAERVSSAKDPSGTDRLTTKFAVSKIWLSQFKSGEIAVPESEHNLSRNHPMCMTTRKDQIASCSTFVRLKQYHDANLVRWGQLMPANEPTDGNVAHLQTRRERQRALDEMRYTSDMLARHDLECPICRLVRRKAA
jgi:hypothetical protein